MKQYESFIFESFSFNPTSGKIELRYSLDGEIEFTETVKLPRKGLKVKELDPELLNRALFALHLIGGISYYKTCCPKSIIVKSGTLSPDEAAFWKEVYENGLGEFFHRNNIDFRDLIHFPSGEKEEAAYIPYKPSVEKVLIPVGGGKDSAVTVSQFKKAKIDATLCRMNSHPAIDIFANSANLPLLTAERTLSPKLFELNEEGALNGHVPITAYVSVLAVLTALLYGHKAVVMSNEQSANVGSTLFYGKEINHQWSKSGMFEKLFQDYLAQNITPDLPYFSLLRPLSELHIVKAFAQLPRYFFITTSCNTNWKLLGEQRATPMWCGFCPKCAFVFTMYAAFLPKEVVTEIFKRNLFEDEALLPLYRQLLGMEGFKPFECVGTPEETKAAFLLILEKNDFNETPVMQLFMRELLPTIKDARETIEEAFTPSPKHFIPPEYGTVLSGI